MPSLTVDGQTVNSNKEIASSMNEYFCNIGIKLGEKVPKLANPLLTGQYPFETLKLARIARILKIRARDVRLNYMPISVLPFISKLFEKSIFNQFYKTWTQIIHYTSISRGFDSYIRLLQPLWPAPIIGT